MVSDELANNFWRVCLVICDGLGIHLCEHPVNHLSHILQSSSLDPLLLFVLDSLHRAQIAWLLTAFLHTFLRRNFIINFFLLHTELCDLSCLPCDRLWLLRWRCRLLTRLLQRRLLRLAVICFSKYIVNYWRFQDNSRRFNVSDFRLK